MYGIGIRASEDVFRTSACGTRATESGVMASASGTPESEKILPVCLEMVSGHLRAASRQLNVVLARLIVVLGR